MLKLFITIHRLFGMNEYKSLTPDVMTPLAEMPAIVNAKTLTTFVWSVLTGTVLYLLLRLILRRPVATLFSRLRKSQIHNLWMKLDTVPY